MVYRPRRARVTLVSVLTSLALLGLTPTLVGTPAGADEAVFAPQLVTVDTPTREASDCSSRSGSTSPSTPGTTTSRSCCTPASTGTPWCARA